MFSQSKINLRFLDLGLRNSDSCLYYGFHSKSALQVWSLRPHHHHHHHHHSTSFIVNYHHDHDRHHQGGVVWRVMRYVAAAREASTRARYSTGDQVTPFVVKWSDGIGLAHCLSLVPAHN